MIDLLLNSNKNNFLIYIYQLSLKSRAVRSVDLARAMNLSKASISMTLNKLIEKGYIDKEFKEANRVLKLESVLIPEDINYQEIAKLASEAREKLMRVKPRTIAQATRISGVNPSDIAILLVYIESNRKRKK